MRFLIVAILVTLNVCVQPVFSRELFTGSLQDPSEDTLRHQIADINERLNMLSRSLDFIELRLSTQASANAAAVLDPARPDKFGTIKTEKGNFLVQISSLEPYVSLNNPERNGYRLTLQIGNLSPATYHGFTVATTWSGQDYVGLRYNQQAFDSALRPSTWNQLSLVLPSTSADEIVNITVGLEVGSVSFGDNLENVLDALARYERAYREMSLSELLAVYPSQPDPETVEAIFQTADSIQMRLTPVGEPRVDGDNASVEAQRWIQQDDLPPVEGHVRLDLRRSGQGWIIANIRLQ